LRRDKLGQNEAAILPFASESFERITHRVSPCIAKARPVTSTSNPVGVYRANDFAAPMAVVWFLISSLSVAIGWDQSPMWVNLLIGLAGGLTFVRAFAAVCVRVELTESELTWGPWPQGRIELRAIRKLSRPSFVLVLDTRDGRFEVPVYALEHESRLIDALEARTQLRMERGRLTLRSLDSRLRLIIAIAVMVAIGASTLQAVLVYSDWFAGTALGGVVVVLVARRLLRNRPPAAPMREAPGGVTADLFLFQPFAFNSWRSHPAEPWLAVMGGLIAVCIMWVVSLIVRAARAQE